MSSDFTSNEAPPAVNTAPEPAAPAPEATPSGPSIREAASAALNSSKDTPARDDTGIRDTLNAAVRKKAATPPAAQNSASRDPKPQPVAKEPAPESPRAEPAPHGDRYMDEIHTFHSAKDASGKTAHPHFDGVLETILQLARVERDEGRLPVLSNLYDSAVWMNPQIRAGLIQQHNAPPPAPARQAPARQASHRSIRGALQQAMGASR